MSLQTKYLKVELVGGARDGETVMLPEGVCVEFVEVMVQDNGKDYVYIIDDSGRAQYHGEVEPKI